MQTRAIPHAPACRSSAPRVVSGAGVPGNGRKVGVGSGGEDLLDRIMATVGINVLVWLVAMLIRAIASGAAGTGSPANAAGVVAADMVPGEGSGRNLAVHTGVTDDAVWRGHPLLTGCSLINYIVKTATFQCRGLGSPRGMVL